VIGVAVPWLAVRLEKSRFFAAAEHYRPLNIATGLTVLGLAHLVNANTFWPRSPRESRLRV
jgi:sodium/hydrogen antiporter